jgi:sacsin
MLPCASCRVGFNSVYHVTDLPGFVSGEHLVFFDPHCKYLPAISAANPGKKINFVAHPVSTKLADQVAPFHFFGCDTQQPFEGTLFRFPLRTQEQADASTISKQVRTGGRRSKHRNILDPTCSGGWL